MGCGQSATSQASRSDDREWTQKGTANAAENSQQPRRASGSADSTTAASQMTERDIRKPIGATQVGKGGASPFHAEFVLGQALGKGAFSQVHLVQRRSGGSEYAVKILNLRRGFEESGRAITDPELVRVAEGEIEALRKVGYHPCLVEIEGFFMDQSFCYIVMEKCPHTLLKRLKLLPELKEAHFVDCFDGMLSGLSHCHAQGVVHRDIKPDNFLCTDKGGDRACLGKQVKLCDFGLAGLLKNNKPLKGVFGTAPFMAPEMLTPRGTYGKPSDVWSFGVLMYVLLLGTFPYTPKEHNSRAMKAVILQGIPPPAFKAKLQGELRGWPSAAAEDTMRRLLDRDPNSRVTAEEARSLSFFVRNDAETVSPLSLRPLLLSARQAGAFNIVQFDEVDKELRAMQAYHAGGS